MARLLLIRGLPGSGKTTTAERIKEAAYDTDRIIILEADMFYVKDGIYEYNSKLAKYAHQWCKSQVVYWLNQDYPVIVANTFLTAEEILPYYEIAKMFNADFDFRTVRGKYKNIHNVPDVVIDKMKTKWEEINCTDFIREHK